LDGTLTPSSATAWAVAVNQLRESKEANALDAMQQLKVPL